MYLDTAVITDKTELAKAIHKEADAEPRGADHLRQSFLRDLRNQRFRFSRIAEFGNQQEDPRQTLFAGVEKLINKIGLDPHAADQEKLREEIGDRILLMHHAKHLSPLDFERSGRRQAQTGRSGNRFFPDEVARREKVIVASFPFFETTVIFARPF